MTPRGPWNWTKSFPNLPAEAKGPETPAPDAPKKPELVKTA